ncbi:hypothetical protein ACHAQH_006344 [Verticillium albo-atrum]
MAEYLSRPRFHQSLTLPATDDHGELKVTYAVGGSQDPSAPTLLFIGGMFGGRYMAVIGDYICRKMGVRIISPDRPGMGSSTPVPIPQRIPVWLETVPVLMQAVGAKHVSLASHSCGVIYALNLLYAMPQILPPDRQALYLFAPWVPPAYSGVKLTSAAAIIPSSLMGRFDSMVSFINMHVAEPVGMSSAAVLALTNPIANAASSLFATQEELERKKNDRDLEQSDLVARMKEHYGCNSEKEATMLFKEIMHKVFEEDTTGGNDEMKLCLCKPEAGPWGECDSYEGFPKRLEQRLRERLYTNEDQSSKFVIRAMWAEEDILVGKGGAKYFAQCFERFGDTSEASCLVYRQETVAKTDHDSASFPHKLAMPRMLSEILGQESMEASRPQD